VNAAQFLVRKNTFAMMNGAPAPSAMTLEPLELIDRLVVLIAPPRIHRRRYHGVLAPNPALVVGRWGVNRWSHTLQCRLKSLSP
jgi:hypothetical protein